MSFFTCDDELECSRFVHMLARVLELVAFTPHEIVYMRGTRAEAMFAVYGGLVGEGMRVGGIACA